MLASTGVDLELVVLDDASTDGTGDVVSRVAAEDARVRLVRGSPLPAGWCGKQHACWQLAGAARHDTWVFLDVDVAPAPDAVARAVAFLDASGAALASGFPRQRTACLLDRLLLPLQLLAYAGIEKDIVLFAHGKKIELWSEKEYKKRMNDNSINYSRLAQKVMSRKNREDNDRVS